MDQNILLVTVPIPWATGREMSCQLAGYDPQKLIKNNPIGELSQ